MASRFLFTIARVRIPSFFGWIPFLCVYTTTFIWSPHPRWTVGSLAPFAAVMNTAPRMGVLVGVQPLFSVFGVYTLMWMWWITGKFYSEVLRNWHTVFHISSVQSLSRVRLFATPWIAARQASLSITNSQSPPRLTSIESVMPSSHLILCRPLLLLPSIPPSIRVFSNESTLST